MPYCTNCGMKLTNRAKRCPCCLTPVKGKLQAPNKPQELHIDPAIKRILERDGKQRQELGETLIQISTHGTSCELCKPFQGKVLIDDVYSGGTFFNSYKKYQKVPIKYRAHVAFLSLAMREGLFHEGCRHGCSTFYNI